MNRKRKAYLTKTVASLLVLGSLIAGSSTSAQVRSGATSVGLVATLPGSVTLQYQSLPMGQSFAENGGTPLEALHVSLTWRLQPGRKIQIQPTQSTEHQTRPLLNSSGFVSMEQFTLESNIFAFQPVSDTQVQVLGAVTASEKESVGRSSFSPIEDSPTLRPIEDSPTLDRKFWMMTAVSVGMTIADVELTQRCIRNGTCHEGNPLLPGTSRSKMYAVQFGLVTAESLFSYLLKKKGLRNWWMPQFSLAASHGVGVAFGMRFVFR